MDALGKVKGSVKGALSSTTYTPGAPATRASTHRTLSALAILFFTVASLWFIDGLFTNDPLRRGGLGAGAGNVVPVMASSYVGADGGGKAGDANSVQIQSSVLVGSAPEPDSATIDPATGQLPLRRALVMSSFNNQDVSWLDELHRVSPGWEVYRYISDAPTDDEDVLGVANPNGREALPYLTFITDNYATLPDFIVFTHGHARSWHQPEPLVDKLVALNLTAVRNEDYVNLRCQTTHGCRDDSKFYIKNDRPDDQRGGKFLKLIWAELMEPEFGPIADVIARPCCAQFAATKQAILRHSLDFWKSLREPLETRKEGDPGWRGKTDYEVGLKYEMFWHVLMGKPAEHCPPKDVCEGVYFSGAIHCNGDGEHFRGHGDFASKKQDFVCVNHLRDD